jgi:hypothetical protein
VSNAWPFAANQDACTSLQKYRGCDVERCIQSRCFRDQ